MLLSQQIMIDGLSQLVPLDVIMMAQVSTNVGQSLSQGILGNSLVN